MPRILFVEDDPFIVEIYQCKFAEAGYEVDNVTNGKAVLKAVLEHPYDLVLLDLVIPEMGGMEVLQELRTHERYPKDLKIVIFSNNLSDTETRSRAVELGVDGVLSKTDFTPTKLIEEVGRLLNLFQERKQNLEKGSTAPEAKPVTSEKKKKILFIEDQAVFIDMFGKRLTQEGYEVVAFSNGSEAVANAEQGNFDIVITDVMLPGMTGEEIVEHLKTNEHTKHIPIFILTASLDTEQFEQFAQSPDVFKAFLKTQITPTELAREVNLVFSTEVTS